MRSQILGENVCVSLGANDLRKGINLSRLNWILEITHSSKITKGDFSVFEYESLERAAAGIGLHVNAHMTEYMDLNQKGDISTLNGSALKQVNNFTYQGSRVASTVTDIDTRLAKAWTAIGRLSVVWKSDLTNKMKRSFFQAAVVSILLYGCTTWTLTKRMEKKLDGNYTRMLRAILN